MNTLDKSFKTEIEFFFKNNTSLKCVVNGKIPRGTIAEQLSKARKAGDYIMVAPDNDMEENDLVIYPGELNYFKTKLISNLGIMENLGTDENVPN